MVRKLLIFGVLAGLGAVLAQALPDILRYFRIRSM